MLFGHNTNITIADTVYHVQTEDRGISNALIDTTVYCRGRVLHRRTDNYFDLLPLDPQREAALKARLDEQHRAVLEAMRSGILHLKPPPVPGQEPTKLTAPPKPRVFEKPLVLLLANPTGWLKGKQAALKVLVSTPDGFATSGAKVTLRVDGAAAPFELSANSGSDGFALLDFEMPKLAGADPAIFIEAAKGTAGGHLRFALRAKPRTPAA
jgi:hypothetical protein